MGAVVTATASRTRRITPTAIRVLPADAPRDQWLERRRDGIGSSDIPAILGVTDYRTPLHVYHDKRGELADDAGEAALWGTLLEDPVAREWARRNRSVIQRVGLIAHDDNPWMMATLDRRVSECPLNRDTREACALEVKCRNAFVSHRWRTDVPDDVLAQVVWQMAVTGFDHMHVAVLIGGNEYRQKVVRRDPDLEAYILGEVRRFRDEHLLPGVPPAWDPDKAAAVIELDKLRHGERAGIVEIDVETIGEVMEYAEASADKSAAERRMKAAKAALALAADGREVITFSNEEAYRYRPTNRRDCDLDRLAEQFPDAYDACVTNSTTYTLVIAQPYRRNGKKS